MICCLCTSYIVMGSWKGGGNQYIQLVSRFCTVNCQPGASNYKLSHLRLGRGSNSNLRGGNCVTTAPYNNVLQEVHKFYPFYKEWLHFDVFIYLGFYVAFNTVQVISRRVVGRAEETSTYSLLGLCTLNCRPTASNYQLSHLRPSRGSNPGLRGGRRECYHSTTVAPAFWCRTVPDIKWGSPFSIHSSCGR